MPESKEKQGNSNKLADRMFREEAGRMAAVLTRLFGFEHYTEAEDIVQDTLLTALEQWKYRGIPDQARPWLYRVARNKAIDRLRRKKRYRELVEDYPHHERESLEDYMDSIFHENEIRDSQLRMIFACCHPALPSESQICLTLKTLCGLSIDEIAKAFLVSDEAITKRLYRARKKIREEQIRIEYPQEQQLGTRLNNVLHSLYLLFNEGYHSTYSEQLLRSDLCEDAMRLTHLLSNHPHCDQSETFALLSLMCFQSARFESRLDPEGHIILLKNQDRSKWNRALIMKGHEYLRRSAKGNHLSTYHLQSAIAAKHTMAPSYEKTDWETILSLYDRLMAIESNPVVALNRAIVLGELHGAKQAMEALDNISGLEDNSYYHTAKGEMLKRAGDSKRAKHAFKQALLHSRSAQERRLINMKLSNCTA